VCNAHKGPGQEVLGLSFEQVHKLHGHGSSGPVVDHKQGQANGRFCRSHRKDKEGKDLAYKVIYVQGEHQEIGVDSQQHQLNRHQHNNDVLSIQEDAPHTQ